ncbi:uncharacterized protein FA14DRAFT_177064 [Meira miltonrushii]|uniref:Uncharacterized protein n=1 Tax=Meira miltonrushii TaxID=1280837 RepID=A0A316VJI4_9BASI|nr:uncharacterized protein FA14DRAFT_177064 [Meira miltonrushii]PWN37782.1 hypothetical protein FA14DRAFT_177064 [Meira miltonrushii]
MINFIIFYVIILLCFVEQSFALPISHTGLATRSKVDELVGIAVSPCVGCEKGTRRAVPRIQRIRAFEDYTVPQGAKRGMLDKVGHAAEKSVKKNWFNVLNGVRMATNLGRQHRKNSTPQVANKSKGGGGGGGAMEEGGVAKGFKSSKGSSS